MDLGLIWVKKCALDRSGFDLDEEINFVGICMGEEMCFAWT